MYIYGIYGFRFMLFWYNWRALDPGPIDCMGLKALTGAQEFGQICAGQTPDAF